MTRVDLALAFSDMFNVTACRDISAEHRPEGGGVESFETDAAFRINGARLTHLASLDLPLDGGRVLGVGAGVGRLTGFFLDRGCLIVATEARSENVAELRRRLPSVDAKPMSRRAWMTLAGSTSSSATESCTTSKALYERFATWRPSATTSY